ncbi:uncharacterized protein BX664DRAFT_293375, partial [Halteromyces radiatus]|uniref:uncharacterized protein n=1 Tax=Halteromyces radiatus TaxID=101107 RepID=UPI002220B05A
MSKLGYPLTLHQSQTTLATDEELNVSEIPPVDTGLIRCICDSNEDDGFTIQCDRCLTWQHAYCMNITQNNIPDRYLCDDCKPKLSKRISVPKRSLQRSMIDSDEDMISKASTRMESNNSRRKDKYQPTNVNTIKSKFVYEVIKETKERWSQSSKWKSQPWRDADQQDIATSTTNIAIRSLPKQQQRSPCKLRKGAFADTQLQANTFLLEAHGELILKSEYKFDSTNNYAILGTPCAHVLFYPTLDLCIDGRRLGNDTRHFRRSCHPNAELRTIVFPLQQSTGSIHWMNGITNGDDDIKQQLMDGGLIRLGIFTRTQIAPGEEITLGWNWQKGHISWRKNVEWCRSSQLEHHQNRTTKQKTRDAIHQMLDRFDNEFGNCACGDHDVCLIERLRQECYQEEDAEYLQRQP